MLIHVNITLLDYYNQPCHGGVRNKVLSFINYPMIDRSFLEIREKIDAALVDRRCCSATMKLGIIIYRDQRDYGFFPIKSEWNFNCGLIMDHITCGGIRNSGLHLVEIILDTW